MADESKSEAAAILEHLPDAAELLGEAQSVVAEIEEEEEDKAADDAAESETETEGEEDDVEKSTKESEEEKPGSEKVQKRIDKLTARAKTAEEKLEAAEAKAKQLESEVEKLRVEPVAAVSANNPLSDVEDAAGLAKRVNDAVALRRWCIENPDGGTVLDKDGNEQEIEGGTARRMLADMEELLSIHAPRRERFLAERTGYEKEARERYPEMFEDGSEMEKASREILRAWPEVKRFPDFRLVLGDYITGLNARKNAAAAADKAVRKPEVKRAIAPPVPKTSTQQKVVKREANAGRVLEQGATLDAMTEYFKSAA
jgi:hypothetical protein